MKNKLPRIFICIDAGRIWEVAGDIEAVLVVKNVEKGWIRHVEVPALPEIVDREEEVILDLDKNKAQRMDQVIEDRKLKIRIDKLKKK